MTAKSLTAIAALPLLLTSSVARADCVDVFGCVCGVNDVVVLANVLEIKEDGYMSVQIERIEEVEPDAGAAWQVGEVLDALPHVQVQVGARAYLTASKKGATDLLVQFNQAEPSGQVACSGVSFDEEDFIAIAMAGDCHDIARARGIEPNCNDEGGCAAAAAGQRPSGAWWLVGLGLGLGALARRRKRAQRPQGRSIAHQLPASTSRTL